MYGERGWGKRTFRTTGVFSERVSVPGRVCFAGGGRAHATCHYGQVRKLVRSAVPIYVPTTGMKPYSKALGTHVAVGEPEENSALDMIGSKSIQLRLLSPTYRVQYARDVYFTE